MKPLHEKNPCNYEVIWNNDNQNEESLKQRLYEEPNKDYLLCVQVFTVDREEENSES